DMAELPEDCLPLADLAYGLMQRDPSQRPTLEAALAVLRPEQGGVGPSLSATAAALVGREDELDAILDAYHARDADRPSVLHLRGLSGVGKSRLCDEAVSRLGRVATVLNAKCHEFEAIPYKGLDDLVDQLVLRLCATPDVARAQLVGEDVAHAARMFPAIFGAFPELPRLPAQSGGVDVRERAYAGLAQLLEALHLERPLCLVLDDAQWGDAGAGHVLASLLTPPLSLPIFWVLAYRSDEVETSALLQQLAPLAGRDFHQETHIDLAPLSATAAVELARRCSHDVDTLELNELVADAGGNPFLIEQLALHGARTRARVSVQDVVRARYQELSDQARSVLRTVSVAGQPLEQQLVMRAAAVNDVRATVATLAAKSLVRVDGAGPGARVVAYHDRIREGVLLVLAPEERRHCHAALARELLAEQSVPPQLVASHLHGAGQLQEAAQYALRAAEEALGSLAYQSAADSYRDALRWSGEDLADVQAVRRAYADALHQAGRCDEAGAAYLRATAGVSDRRARMELQRLAAEALLSAGAVREAFEILRPLFADAGVPFPKDSGAALRGLLWATAQVRMRVRGDLALGSRRVDEDAAFKSALCWSVGKGLSNIAPVEGTVTILRSLLYALDSGSPRAIANGLLFVGSGFTPFMGSRPDDFMGLARRIADADESPALRGLLHVAWCQRGLLEGTWDAAIEHGDRAVLLLSSAPEPTAWSVAVARTTITACLEYRGRLGEMRSRSEEFLRQTANSGEQITFVMVTSAVGFTLGAAGDAEGLARAIDDMRRTMHSWTVDFGMWDFYRLRLEVLERLNGEQPESALALVDAAWPAIRAANLLRVPVVLPAILHVRLAAEVAAWCARPGDRRLRRRVERTRDELRVVKRPDGPALALVAQAALSLASEASGVSSGSGASRAAGASHTASSSRAREAARAELERALAACDAARLGAHALLCRRALLELGAEGAAADDKALMDSLAAHGIADPPRWARYVTPGFGAGQLLRPLT
ncbi:MAG: AAA family ATPase, partial [Myxococcales bacterium]|nr:AAA family ATPase [Myxococcales bacterium]